jgi:hypothetical protein
VDGGVRHLGFAIPLDITLRQGQRDREPGRGVCAECGVKRKCYVRGDGTLYCADCITFDLAEASPSDEVKKEQRHPPLEPTERLWEKVKGTFSDDFELRAIVPGPDPDPRLWDRAFSA